MVSEVEIHDLERSIRASKYPMAVDVAGCSTEVTPTVNKLASSPPGTAHNNFLSGITVRLDLTFSNKVWVEAERYHFFQIVSSQSTMHRISRFDLDESYVEYVDKRIIGIMKELVDKYNETGDPEDYLRLLYSNPAGFKLTADISTNYLQLKTIYQQRRNHRLPEWQAFCDWIETLPHSEWLTNKASE